MDSQHSLNSCDKTLTCNNIVYIFIFSIIKSIILGTLFSFQTVKMKTYHDYNVFHSYATVNIFAYWFYKWSFFYKNKVQAVTNPRI